MTILLTGSGGLFTIFRKVVSVLSSANTSQGTTIPDLVDNLLAEVQDADTVDGMPLVSRLSTAVAAFKGQTNLQRELAAFFRNLLIDRVITDAPHVNSSQDSCVDELIRQMNAAIPAQTVERNVVSASVSLSPSGAPTLFITDTGGDGKSLQQLIPEKIVGRYQSPTALLLESGTAERDKLSHAWPTGSGIRQTLLIDASGLLTNQSFDQATTQAHVPDSWTVTVGAPGTTVVLTATEIQTITIAGGPTSGHWKIKYTSAGGIEQWTDLLPYNASASDVQSALAELLGMATVEVTSTGTLPADVIYTVKFNAVSPPGNISALAATHNFNTGSITVAEATAGEPSYEHRALGFLGNGSELTAIRQALQGLGLAPSTCYALSVQLKAGSSGTTGTLIIELTDGTGAVLADDSGNTNRLTIDLSSIGHTAFAPSTTVFRTPANLPDVFYLQVRLSAAINASKSLYLDDMVFQPMIELYRGGPFAALAPKSRLLQSTDRYEITVTNNFAGNLQTYFGRIFDRQLPSAASGSETIAD
jgi:hypothetical protein